MKISTTSINLQQHRSDAARWSTSLRPRTVVFVESAAAMGGVEFSTLYLARHLDRSRWEPLVVCPEEGDLPRTCRHAGVPVAILPRPAWRSTSIWIRGDRRLPNPLAWGWDAGVILAVTYRLARFLELIQPDLVVTKGLFSHFYGGGAARRVGVPCIWHVQDFVSERFGGIYRKAFGHTARWLPDLIVADGEPIVFQLPHSVRKRVSVIYNGVDTEVFRPDLDGRPARAELGIPANALVVGHAARITPWKGQHYLLEAFAQVAVAHPDTYLLFVGAPIFDGDSYERRLRQMASDLGLRNRVIFAGYRHDLPNVLAAMDIFAYTSVEKDTSPLALLSAMAARLPIVAFDIAGVREVVDEGAGGLLVPVGQPDALARSLTRVIVDSDFRRRLAVTARRRAEMSFSLDQYVQRMEEVFLRCLDCQRRPDV